MNGNVGAFGGTEQVWGRFGKHLARPERARVKHVERPRRSRSTLGRAQSSEETGNV